MKKTPVIILTIFIVAGIYDFGSVYVLPDKLPSISSLFSKYAFQFSFWEAVLFLTLGHLFFNRNAPELTRARLAKAWDAVLLDHVGAPSTCQLFGDFARELGLAEE